jgi:PTS system mannose-specific IID component
MKLDKFRTWLRLFVVQGSWNYDRMVGLGLAFALEPLLRSLAEGKDSSRYRAALAGAAQFFNAHPYLVGLAAGALAREEHQGSPREQVDRLRTALIGPLGSVGDRLFWAGWLPLCSALGIVGAAVLSPLAGVVLFLVLYNVLHLPFRYWALEVGWRRGSGVAAALGSAFIRRGSALVAVAAAGAAGFMLPVAAAWLTKDLPAGSRIGAALVLAVCVVVGRWLLPSAGATRVGMAIVVTAALAAVLWR